MNGRPVYRAGPSTKPDGTPLDGCVVGALRNQGGEAGEALPGGLWPPAKPAEAGDAKQGHSYDYFGTRVLALTGGPRPTISAIEGLWIGRAMRVDAADLVQLPMAYFHNEVPK